MFRLPVKSSTLDATTRQGTVQLDGGFVVKADGRDVLALDDPELVVGATPQASGLFALVNGVRVKIGDVDPAALKLTAADGVITVSDLNVLVSTPGAVVLNAIPGITGVTAGSQLLNLNLSVPQV